MTFNKEKTAVKQWHDGIDGLLFETKTGSLNWYSFTKIFVMLFDKDWNGLIVQKLNGGLVFVRNQHVSINPNAYTYLTNPNVGFQHFIDITYCGKSSYSALQLVSDNHGNTLASNRINLVYVDMETRKSMHLPEFFCEAVIKSHPLSKANQKFDLKEFTCPVDYFKMDITVVYTDLDTNGHATQTSYIRHVLNTFIAGGGSTVLGSLTINDILTMQEFRSSYESEANLGDKLVVKVWYDKYTGLHAHIVDKINPEKVFVRANLGVGNIVAKL
ncbi:uncharacterized protein [Antedon mediterranea]|uniref:uncharacterized protein n=1 Tax=Antedon mediterranea TaxID=105859 RepID=UPI003AF788CF